MRFWGAWSVSLSLLAAPAWCCHTLAADQQKVLASWLVQHAEYRVATDSDCQCEDDIARMRAGYGDPKEAVPDYHPYCAIWDFNNDGTEDFAVILIDGRAQTAKFTLAVFNGPLTSRPLAPAFVKRGLHRGDALFYGPPGTKPSPLLVGPFESYSGFLLVPGRGTYKIKSAEP